MIEGGWGFVLMAVLGPIILGAAILYGSREWRQRRRVRPDAMQLGEAGDTPAARASSAARGASGAPD